MRSGLTIVFSIVMAGPMLAQPFTSFLDTTYNLDGRSDWFNGLCRVDAYYYIPTWTNANGIADYGIGRLNVNGELDSLAIYYDTTTYENAIDIVAVESNKIAMAIIDRNPTTLDYQYKIAIADTHFDLLATDKIGNDTLDEGCQALCYSNGKVVLTGSRRNPRHLGNQDIYLAAWDTAGNILWDREIGTSQYNENSYGITTTSDNGYIIGGYRQYWGQNQIDWLIVKTDSLGNQEWEKTFGGG